MLRPPHVLLGGRAERRRGRPWGRDGALEQDQALVGVDGVDGEVLGGDGVGTHPAGHPHALEDAAGGGAGADRAGLAVVAVGAVGGATPWKPCRFMTPAKPLPLLVPVTSISSPAAKVSTASSWPTVYVAGVGGADLDEVAARRGAGLGEVARPAAWSPCGRRSRRTRPGWRCSRPSRGSRTWVTTLVPAAITVTGTMRLFSSHSWVMPSLVPSSPFTLRSMVMSSNLRA